MKVESIRVGGVYRFKSGDRRVIKLTPVAENSSPSHQNVEWEYADKVKRAGKFGNTQWMPYFASQAKEEILDQKIPTAAEKWPALQDLAVRLANDACKRINEYAPKTQADGMPYKAQCTLELLITELERRV